MSEHDFIELLKKGDNQAFGQLLDNYQAKVFGSCISFVPNKEDAEDIAQEVFLEVFNSISKFNEKSKLSTWIYRIAVNKSLEFIRKKNTKKRFGFMLNFFDNDIEIDRSSYFTEFNHPGIQLEHKEKTEVLFAAINKLPEAQRIVYTLSKIEGLSYQEVSAVTQKSIPSIESLLFRSKKKLRILLKNYYQKAQN